MTKIKDKHFEILGLTRQSTSNEIKKAFKSLIKIWHPDKILEEKKIIDATRKSQEIIEAYTLLKDYKSPIIKNQNANDSKSNSEKKQSTGINWQGINRTRVILAVPLVTHMLELPLFLRVGVAGLHVAANGGVRRSGLFLS